MPVRWFERPDYEELRKRIECLFQNIEPYTKQHSISVVIPAAPSCILLSGPGYKWDYKKRILDYRVEIQNNFTEPNGTAITHVGIIRDIYTKVREHPQTTDEMNRYLMDMAKNALRLDEYTYPLLRMFYGEQTPKSPILNVDSPENAWGYSMREFTVLVIFIAMQEDINYPMPHCAGRRMPFSRYLEAVYCAAHPAGSHKLEEVISRALSKGHPPAPWTDTDIPYSAIQALGER